MSWTRRRPFFNAKRPSRAIEISKEKNSNWTVGEKRILPFESEVVIVQYLDGLELVTQFSYSVVQLFGLCLLELEFGKEAGLLYRYTVHHTTFHECSYREMANFWKNVQELWIRPTVRWHYCAKVKIWKLNRTWEITRSESRRIGPLKRHLRF